MESHGPGRARRHGRMARTSARGERGDPMARAAGGVDATMRRDPTTITKKKEGPDHRAILASPKIANRFELDGFRGARKASGL
jgi:hypothetical protein